MQAESCSATLLISSGCSPSAGKDQWCLQAGDTCKIQVGVCGSVFSAISSRWTASSPKSQGGAAQQCRYNWILLLWLCAGWNWSVHALGHGRDGGGIQVMESTCLSCWLHHLNSSAELLHSSAPAQLGHLRETFGHMELDGTLWTLKSNSLVCNLVFISNTQGSVSEFFVALYQQEGCAETSVSDDLQLVYSLGQWTGCSLLFYLVNFSLIFFLFYWHT